MSRTSRRPLVVSETELRVLRAIASSRTEGAARVLRAQMILEYHAGKGPGEIARDCNILAARVAVTIKKAVAFGAIAALDDLHRDGRPRQITDEARSWIVSVACTKPCDQGYAEQTWTHSLLAQHVRKNGPDNGHACLAGVVKSTICKILAEPAIKPHKYRYYLEKRDPQFEEKLEHVLCFYREIAIWQASGLPDHIAATISCDEKPGIQALANVAPDLPPQQGRLQKGAVGRDYEYKRHGTVSLIAGMNLVTGHVHGIVRDRHRTREFIEFLEELDSYYPKDRKIRLLLDNHSSHRSKELQRYLATVPNRFEFVFTPTHASWLNQIEVFFSKMARTLLRGIRVKSKPELVRRIGKYLDQINENPKPFKWTYKIDAQADAQTAKT